MKYIKSLSPKTIFFRVFMGLTVFIIGILAGYGLYKKNNIIKNSFPLEIFPFSTACIDSAKMEITKRKETKGRFELEIIIKDKNILQELSPLQVFVLKGNNPKKEIISRLQYTLHSYRNTLEVKIKDSSCYIEVGYFKIKDFYQKDIPVFYSRIFYQNTQQ